MPLCRACGQENPEVARFCLACGTSLAEASLPGDERRIVTVIFVDLVGFTARTERLDPEDVRYRMFTGVRELQPAQLMRFTQIDYDREMAFIATRRRPDGESETLGVARAVADPDNQQAEFAVVVRSDLKGKGLGPVLMTRLVDYCRRRGTGELVGEALSHNSRMLNMMTRLGFEVKSIPGEGLMRLHLALRPRPDGL